MLPVGRTNIIREAQGCQLPPSVTSRVDRVVRDRALVGRAYGVGDGDVHRIWHLPMRRYRLTWRAVKRLVRPSESRSPGRIQCGH